MLLSLKSRLILPSLFFVYGSALHVLAFWVFFGWGGPPERTEFVNPVTNLIFALVGGLFVAWFMTSLFRKALQGKIGPPFLIMIMGGAYGVLSTILALLAFFFLFALIVTFRPGFPATLPWTPVLAFMSAFFYGLGSVAESFPFGFLYGALAGAFVWWMKRQTA